MQQIKHWFESKVAIQTTLVAPLLLLLIPLFSVLDREKVLFPGTTGLVFEYYADDSENGTSQVTAFLHDSTHIRLSYILRSGYDFPFVGFTIYFSSDSAHLNVGRYDFLTISIQSENAKSFKCYLKTHIEGFTRPDEFMTHRFLMTELPIRYGQHLDRIVLDRLKTPSWWFEGNKVLEAEMPPPDFRRLTSIAIESGSNLPRDSLQTIIISKIAFEKDLKTPLLRALGIMAILYSLIGLLWFVLQRRRDLLSPHVVIGYKKLEVGSDQDAETRRVTDYIAEHYSDSELTVEKLGREVGIHPTRIPSILKKQYQLSYKQYLNIVRIEEAKRLLRESDKQVVDIAYTVGYNNIPHFNRTFKDAIGVSPNQYRKQERQSQS